ncbi:MAG: ParA family protein [Metallosphaera sp.]
MAKIARFSVMSLKGGVGKSTLAYYLAKELSKRYNVLLVDRDYNNTIGKIYGLETGLLNVLGDGVEGKFYDNIGKLRVLSLVSFSPSSLPSLGDFARAYSNFLEGVDVIITDNPPGFDEIMAMEFKGYYEVMGEVHCSSVVVTTPGVSLSLTLSHLNDIGKTLVSWVPQISFARLLALVVNMVKGNLNIEIPGINVIQIPFYKELLFRSFVDSSIRPDLDSMIRLMEERIKQIRSGGYLSAIS